MGKNTVVQHNTDTNHEPEQVSAFLETRICELTGTMTVQEALKKLHAQVNKAITIYYGYVVDTDNKIVGVVSMRQLLTAQSEQVVAEVMERNVICAYADEDQEVAAKRVLHHDLVGLPIITRDKQLLGLLTRKAANRIMAQEQTEDFEKMMAIGGRHQAGVYLSTTSMQHFKNRIIWLSGLAILGFVSGYILHSYEETLATFLILALYIPMVADTGGNTGSQSATVVIRALALGEVSTRDGLRVLFKEFKVSLLIAVILGIITFTKIMLLSGGQAGELSVSLSLIAVAITAALMLQVITSNVIGAILPLLVAKFNLDPATVASPALTTIVDITGLLIFFSIATRALGIN